MKEIFYTLLMQILHPFETQRYFRAQRLQGEGINNVWRNNKTLIPLSVNEITLIAWLASILAAIYFLLGVNLGIKWMANLPREILNGEQFINVLSNLKDSKIFIMTLTLIFFPLFFWIYARIVRFIVKFFASIFGASTEVEAINEVISGTFSSYSFLALPIIGEAMSAFSFVLNLFAGLRENLKLTIAQSVLIIISPILILIGGIASFVMLITLFFIGLT